MPQISVTKAIGGMLLSKTDKSQLNKLWSALRRVIAPLTGNLRGSATHDPANLVDGAGVTTTVTVTGAALGDFVVGVSAGVDLQGITVTAYVSAANTVSVRYQNETGGAIDLASHTLRAVVMPFGSFVNATDLTA